MQAITKWLKNEGYDCIEDKWYARIKLWQSWYQGKVSRFHRYRQYNGKRYVGRERKSLGMAKTIAEDWANLALNEKVEIVIDDETASQTIHSILRDNRFRVRGNQLVELAFALGTAAIVEYRNNDKICMDYIRAGMIYPLSWDNGEITECAFGSEYISGKEKHVYLNIHRLDEAGNYVIENHVFCKTGEVLTEIELPEDIEPEYGAGTNIPCFQIIKPNIANNLNPDSPMGIAVYANAVDQLEGIDLVYDSYCNEFRLGKKRITVPISMTQRMLEETGESLIFDDSDTEFYAVPGSAEGENKIVEHNMELRADAHEKGMQTALNMLSLKCGMGKDRYNFQDGQVKTATEVVSEKSDLFQNLKKHEILLEDALIGMVRAIAQLAEINKEFNISIQFDDSIIEDVGAEKQRFLQEIRDGVRQKWEYRVQYLGEDESTAKAMTTLNGEGADPFGLAVTDA